MFFTMVGLAADAWMLVKGGSGLVVSLVGACFIDITSAFIIHGGPTVPLFRFRAMGRDSSSNAILSGWAQSAPQETRERTGSHGSAPPNGAGEGEQ
jgi:hypothetical protein